MSAFTPSEEVLEHYVQNRLSPAEEEQVELWLMDNPEALEERFLDLSLKVAVTEIGPHLENQSSHKPWFFYRWVFPAATAALGVLSIGLMLALSQQQVEPNAIAGKPSFLSLEQSMSAGQAAGARISRNDQFVVFDLDVGSGFQDFERLKLIMSAEGENIENVDLEESAPGFAQFVLNPAALESSQVWLRVVGISRDRTESEVAQYRLEVIDD